MKYWTWAEIKQKMEVELDLQGEIFIEEAELLGYANDAIDEAEAQIHSLNEDYFLTSEPLTLVSGTSEYALPTSIFANKLRTIMYQNGQDVYEVKRIVSRDKFLTYAVNNANNTTTPQYRYFLKNASAGAPRILFTPRINVSGNVVELWFIRNANRLVDDASICDIPEHANYVFKYLKKMVYAKDGHPQLATAIVECDAAKTEMIETLSQMVPDGETQIEPDMELYDEMS